MGMENIEILREQTYFMSKLYLWIEEEKMNFRGQPEFESLCWCIRNLVGAAERIHNKISWQVYLKEAEQYDR